MYGTIAWSALTSIHARAMVPYMLRANLASNALALASRGMAVFPLEGGRKRPIGRLAPHGCRSASRDLEVVEAWWRRAPRANIGLATGRASARLVVIDLDVADGIDGRMSLAELEEDLGALPATARAATPSGGEHIYLRYPEDVTIRNSASRLAACIDVRAEGGYVVAPPSVRRGSGSWRWLTGARGIADLPDAWVERLRHRPEPLPPVPPRSMGRCHTGATYAEARLDQLVAMVTSAVRSTRNETLNLAAWRLGLLVRDGLLGEQRVADALYAAALAAGLGERETIRTIESGLRAGERAARR